MASVNLSTLKTELTTDPDAIGYSLADNAGDRDLLNLKRATVSIDVLEVSSSEVVDAIEAGAWDALSAAEKEQLTFIITAQQVNMKAPNMRQIVSNMFPNSGATQATRQALIAMQTRDGSRSEKLFGEGVSVTSAHVNEALAL